MSTKRSGFQTLSVVLILTLVGGGLWWLAKSNGWLDAEVTTEVRGAPVQRGPLRISVTERGSLKAADSVALKSEIEGSTTILYLVSEGTLVEEGTLLCELDATELIDKRFQQEISVRNAEAAFVKSKQNFEIQKSQNDSDIKKAEQSLFFAETDLNKFLEGERLAKEAEADEAIKLAEEKYTRDQEKVEWSQRLNERSFLTDTELQADQLTLSTSTIQLEQAKRDKGLLIRFQLPRDEAELKAKLEEAHRELERVKLQAAARIVDFEADMDTNEAKLRLEREKLAKLETQINKAKLYAPRSGMVVYAQEEGGRYGSSQPIKEGTQVRERQEIVTIPSAGGMTVQVSLHESVLKQVQVGLPVLIKVDALPGREFQGRVRFVGVLPDQNSWWANPNLRLYRTDVAIEDSDPEMRPGMSCAVEILVQELEDATYVPVQAVFRRGADNLVFVDQDGKAEERKVEVGQYNDRWVQILDGVSEGEIVRLSPPTGFRLQSDEAAGRGPESARPGADGAPMAPLAAGGPAASGPEAGAAKPGTEGVDPARAEEFRKRFENMTEEERAKAMEAFRSRAGGGGAPGGGGPGGGGGGGGRGSRRGGSSGSGG